MSSREGSIFESDFYKVDFISSDAVMEAYPSCAQENHNVAARRRAEQLLAWVGVRPHLQTAHEVAALVVQQVCDCKRP